MEQSVHSLQAGQWLLRRYKISIIILFMRGIPNNYNEGCLGQQINVCSTKHVCSTLQILFFIQIAFIHQILLSTAYLPQLYRIVLKPYPSRVNKRYRWEWDIASCSVMGCFDWYWDDWNGRRTIIMNILNSYLLANTTGNRQAGQRRGKRRETAQYQFFNNEYKRRSASLVDIYSTRLKELTEESKEEKADVRWKKTIQREDNSLVVENAQRVEKTINSVNEYAEQLRVTLINQYKSHKMQSMRGRKPQQHQESISPRLQLQALNLRSQVQKPVEQHLGLKESQKSPAYKTLNLLYQAIIDNSFQKRRKDDFELQAVRLPIVDRFNPYNQASKSDYEPQITFRPDNTKRIALSLPQHKIEHSRTIDIKYSKRPGVPRRRSSKQHRQQQGDIIPWRTEEEGYFE